MQVVTPFDAAMTELLRSWRVWDDLRTRTGGVSLQERTAAFVALDEARNWVGAFSDAGRQPCWQLTPFVGARRH